jgi:hypothetical protein
MSDVDLDIVVTSAPSVVDETILKSKSVTSDSESRTSQLTHMNGDLIERGMNPT